MRCNGQTLSLARSKAASSSGSSEVSDPACRIIEVEKKNVANFHPTLLREIDKVNIFALPDYLQTNPVRYVRDPSELWP
eukprot:scaffold29580_cov37-Attheya_sp.AAC.1